MMNGCMENNRPVQERADTWDRHSPKSSAEAGFSLSKVNDPIDDRTGHGMEGAVLLILFDGLR